MQRELADHGDVFESLYVTLRVKHSLGEHPAADALAYEVVTATSPQQALEWATRHAVDLLVTDIAMPGMDGMELAVQMRRTHPDLSVIVVSGQADLQTLRDSVNLSHLDFFIAKPWEREQLKLFVAQALVGQIIRREHRLLAGWLRERGLA
jgi:DNA-binding NtrC family response regulator